MLAPRKKQPMRVAEQKAHPPATFPCKICSTAFHLLLQTLNHSFIGNRAAYPEIKLFPFLSRRNSLSDKATFYAAQQQAIRIIRPLAPPKDKRRDGRVCNIRPYPVRVHKFQALVVVKVM